MPERRAYEDSRVFMNTLVKIRVTSDLGTVRTRQKISEAYNQFGNVVKRYTRFDKSSDLARLNQNPEQHFEVSDELFELVKLMLDLANLSGGAYDPTIIDLLEAYGYDSRNNFENLNSVNLLHEIRQLMKTRPSFKDIVLNEKAHTIRLQKKQRLDLGSIGKGYAIDLAYDVLAEFPGFIINAGGDIRAKGEKSNGSPWRVGILELSRPNRNPHPPKAIGAIELDGQSLAASGGWSRRVKFFHHLLSTRTGLPINETSQSYVLAKNATLADVWATILFTMGDAGIELINSQQDIEGTIFYSNGKISTSRGFSYLG
ncbi:MAG: FAD:protein FMN transferase [Candidatus Dojkabacteria bacterium]